ncbi:MAG: DUF429 domain-containing protein [Bdellovibrionales bacterium]|nr:DUF429 domain-containing protein [Bdellovibrionales bacterium]
MKPKKIPFHRFIGISLAGGKTSKTQMAIIDFYPLEKKAFLTHTFRDIGEEHDVSADTHLVNLINAHKGNLESIAVDAPLSDPPGLKSPTNCPGVEKSENKAIRWMWDLHKKNHKEKRPNKIFTPYTERCVEQYLSSEVDPYFPMDHALGSNRAPLWARVGYLKKRLNKLKWIEVFPRLNIWRIGRALKVNKTPLQFYKNAVEGADHRAVILNRFMDEEWLFIYAQDAKNMVKDASLFDAVFAAFTGYLHFKKQCETPPKNFPKGEGWIQFPTENFTQAL